MNENHRVDSIEGRLERLEEKVDKITALLLACLPGAHDNSKNDENINTLMHNADRISELPDAIIVHHIFPYLSMKTAVRTSALSSRWRHLWTSILNLDFDCEVWNSIGDQKSEVENWTGQKRNEFAGIIDRFLERHNEPHVKRLRLCFYPGDEYRAQTVKWLKLAVMKDVGELDLDFYMKSGKKFDLPKFVMDCTSILSLKLTYCNLKLPSKCKGLSFLRMIYLNQVTISDDLVEWLISHCQQLESLCLIECPKLQHVKMSSPAPRLKNLKAVNYSAILESIEIDAPNLITLVYSGHHVRFTLKDVSGLQCAMLNTTREGERHVTIHEDQRLLLSEFTCVKTLYLSDYFFQVFAGSSIYPYLPAKLELQNLKELQLSVRRIIYRTVTAITYLLLTCPLLEKLIIDANQPPNLSCRPDDPWLYEVLNPDEDIDAYECVLDHLKIVEFTGFTATASDFMLVRILLSSAHMLDSLLLVHPPDYRMDHIMENILWAMGSKYKCTGVPVPPSHVVGLLLAFSDASPKPNVLLLPEAQSCRFVF